MAVKIKGLIELQRKLDALPKVAKDHIKKEMEVAAGDAVAFMRRIVPVEDGDLRDSIGWTWGKPPRGASIVASVKSTMGGSMTITIYAGGGDQYYARFVEFGTKNMTARPFFYVSWRAVNKGRNNPKARVRRAVRDAARQVAAGG